MKIQPPTPAQKLTQVLQRALEQKPTDLNDITSRIPGMLGSPFEYDQNKIAFLLWQKCKLKENSIEGLVESQRAITVVVSQRGMLPHGIHKTNTGIVSMAEH
ncbi:hypothetical protein LCP963914a_9948 [Penicillium roqueforti]|nr:hypothetical protein LCP963914a_9948 [Penicillium roqueforti]